MNIPHLSGQAQEQRLVAKVDETPFAIGYPRDTGLPRLVKFWRSKWKYGGYITIALCHDCKDRHEAGGAAGERALKLWAERHDCQALPAQYEVDEDQKLFRH